MLDKHGDGVDVRILTKSISPQLQLDIEKHNSQYSPIKLEVFTNSHDRFLCIDDTVYNMGHRSRIWAKSGSPSSKWKSILRV